MRTGPRLLLAALVLAAAPLHAQLSPAQPNDNRAPAGELRDGVLRVSLRATRATWHPDGDSLPGVAVDAFAEAGEAPSMPGPLLRMPAGTELHLSIANTLPRDTLTFRLPPGLGGAADSVVVPPGEARELRARPRAGGNHAYHATTSRRITNASGFGWMLSGALIVDPPGAVPDDRVLVIQIATDSLVSAGFAVPEVSLFAINGRSWPHTERLDATAGDTLRWKVINASPDVHPMHLHGFYFQVDAVDGVPPVQRIGVPGRRAVTERIPGFTGMAMRWVPERAGNWLFHCHVPSHVIPHRPLGPVAAPAPEHAAGGHDAGGGMHANHAHTGMSGLVMGIHVRPRPGAAAAAEPAPVRRLRMVAVRDSAFPAGAPSMRFVVHEAGAAPREAGPGISPTLHLRRGEPVAITVVNQLAEPTAVHWHGIELESYFDGVPGFGGDGARVTPVVAPRDSFEARFTPPRAGTFIYHSHVDEPRQHRAGLLGALLVHDSLPADGARDLLFFLKPNRAGDRGPPLLEINGDTDPDTLVLRAGERYRLRFIGLQAGLPNATVTLTARGDSLLSMVQDSLLVEWRPVAKDGADLPDAERRPRPARQILSVGETYDFELVPDRPGPLRMEVRLPGFAGRLVVRVPIRVE
ncbi:MAG TPA: multicopper oxidase domain-containing protein [Longimicrobium sp.]|nr:multicopper oxidase domain-containing protein [Longimicrobium sp.]